MEYFGKKLRGEELLNFEYKKKKISPSVPLGGRNYPLRPKRIFFVFVLACLEEKKYKGIYVTNIHKVLHIGMWRKIFSQDRVLVEGI